MTDETNKPMDEPIVPPPPAEADVVESEPSFPTTEEAAVSSLSEGTVVPATDDPLVEPAGVEPAGVDGPTAFLDEPSGAEPPRVEPPPAELVESIPMGLPPVEEPEAIEASESLVAEEPENPEPENAEPIEILGPSEPVPVEQAPAAKKKPAERKARQKSPAEGSAEEVPEEKSENMQWYILKVQSNREESIREGLQRRVAIAGLGRFFGDAIVPIEKVTEVKGGRKRVIKRKLYPGYLVVQMEINDDTWFLVRETPGIGDFTGAAGRPTPMLPHEVARIVSTQEEKTDAAPKLQIAFHPGDRVKINEGTFENFEGEVETIDTASGRVIVMINIFGRSTPVELEYWQIESL